MNEVPNTWTASIITEKPSEERIMNQRQLAGQILALQDLLVWLTIQTPKNLPDFTVYRALDSWSLTAVPASTIYQASPPLLDEMRDLADKQKACDAAPVDEDDPCGKDSMLQVRRQDLAERLTEEVSLTLLVGRLMAHVRRRRTGRLIAALQSGVRAILDAAPPAGPSREEA